MTAAAVHGLEEVAARGWPAPHTEWYGRWLLRAGEGWTRRANSVLVLGDPPAPLDEAVDAVHRWYAGHGLRAAFSVPLPVHERLDGELAARGWRTEMDTEVLTATLDAGRPAGRVGGAVRLTGRPPPGWGGVYRAGTPLPPVARRILTAPPLVTFASVVDGGRVVATGRGVVTDGWLGIAAVEVVESHRRRGLATAVTRAIQDWGRAHGASRCYLQVMAANTPALGLYARLGFGRHHSYRQRVPAQPAG